jgi:hypothetical protein
VCTRYGYGKMSIGGNVKRGVETIACLRLENRR